MIAAVIGGLGSLGGALLGSLLLGMLETLVSALSRPPTATCSALAHSCCSYWPSRTACLGRCSHPGGGDGYLETILILSCVSAVAALGLAVLTGYADLYSSATPVSWRWEPTPRCSRLARGCPYPGAAGRGALAALVAFSSVTRAARQAARRLFRHRHARVRRGGAPAPEQLAPALGGAIGLTNLPMRSTPALALGVTIAASGEPITWRTRTGALPIRLPDGPAGRAQRRHRRAPCG